METQDSLEPIDPSTAVQMYLQERESELSDETHQSHGYRLERFLEWCEEEDVEDMNNLTGRDLHKFKLWRQSQNVATWTVKSNLDTLRVFIRFCERIDACRDNLHESIDSPSTEREKPREKDILPEDRATEILAYLDRYEYASIHHTFLRLLWASGMRMGAARSIDLQDCNWKEEYVELIHRPDSDTPLKNKEKGERIVALDSKTCRILQDYIETNRKDVEDEFGREPVFTTKHGRITKNTIRTYIYRVTRPCEYTRECPFGREINTCEAMQGRMSASKCPDSVAPHAIRRGAITHYLSEDCPTEIISDRMDLSKDVLDDHYDARTELEKMEQRREFIERLDV